MAKHAMYCFAGERIAVERVGSEYAVIRGDGSVHEHRTYTSEREATHVVCTIANRKYAQLETERDVVETTGEEVACD